MAVQALVQTTPSGASLTINIVRRHATETAPESIWFDVSVTGFDSTGPTGGNIYDNRLHKIDYYWTFGDPGTFTAPVNLLSGYDDSNIWFGPKAVHVFQADGTFTVSCWAYEKSSGKSAFNTLQVTVKDPDVEFAGADTITVGPTGRDHTTLDAAISAVKGQQTTPKRIVLDRDETFSCSGGAFGNNAGNQWPSVYITAEDVAGAKPIVNFTGGFSWDDIERGVSDKDFVFSDLDLRGGWDSVTETGTSITFLTNSRWKVRTLLLNRCEFSKFAAVIVEAANYTEGPSDGAKVLNDSIVTDWQDYGFAIDSRCGMSAAVGSRIAGHVDAHGGGAKDGSHNTHGPWRNGYCDVMIAYALDVFNRQGWFVNFAPYNTQQPCLRAMQGTSVTGDVATDAFVSVVGCCLEGGNSCLEIKRQNGTITSKPMNGLVAQNYMLGSHMTARMIYLEYGGITVRDNIFNFADVPRVAFAPFDPDEFVRADYPGDSTESRDAPIEIYGNTCVSEVSTANYAGTVAAPVILTNSGFTDTTEENNIRHVPNITSPVTPDGPLVENDSGSFGWTPREKGYTDETVALETQRANPSDAVNSYKPDTGSAALDPGLAGLVSYRDVLGAVRPAGNEDRGANQVST